MVLNLLLHRHPLLLLLEIHGMELVLIRVVRGLSELLRLRARLLVPDSRFLLLNRPRPIKCGQIFRRLVRLQIVRLFPAFRGGHLAMANPQMGCRNRLLFEVLFVEPFEIVMLERLF